MVRGSRHPGWRDWLLLVALTVMWGSAFALTKAAITNLGPDTVVLGRLVLGAIVLVGLWVVTRHRAWPSGMRLWLFFIGIAIIGNVVPFNLISWGQQYIDSGLAGLLMAVMPLFTLALAHLFVAGERLTPSRVAGFVIGLVGVAVLLLPDIAMKGVAAENFAVATAAVLLAAFCYAVSVVLTQLRPPSDVLSTATATTTIAALIMVTQYRFQLPAAELHAASAVELIAVAVLGVFSTAVAALVYFRLVERAGPAFVSQLNYLIPVWAVLLGAWVYGERPSATDYLAMAIILLGIAVSQRKRSDPVTTAPSARVTHRAS